MYSIGRIINSSRLFSLLIAGGLATSLVAADPSRPWQRGFQTPASPIAEGIVAFHDDLRIFLTGILCFVRYVLTVCLHRFGRTTTADGLAHPVDRLVHASTLEII
jgi:hypothetical protein